MLNNSHARVGPKSQPLLLCSLPKVHHSQESLQSLFSFPFSFLITSLSLSLSHRHTHTHTKPTLLYSLFKLPSSSISFSLAMVVETMPCLVHHLLLLPSLLLLLAAAGSGVHCIGEKKVVSLEALQWRKNSLHQPVLPQRSSKI